MTGDDSELDLYSPRLQHVLQVAEQAACARYHAVLGPEHLLLGVLAEHDGVAAAVFDALRLDRNVLHARVTTIIGAGDASTELPDPLPIADRAARALALAAEAAQALDHTPVCTEHLLLGLLREPYSVAAQVLTHAGLSDATVEAETLRLLGAPAGRSVR